MNLRKFGGVEGGFTLCVDKSGHEHVLVVGKATFNILPTGQCELSSQQHPVVSADQHYGDPATSSVRYESDFALRKPYADIVLNATAHAPDGLSTAEMFVAFYMGDLRKVIRVTGDRVWERSIFGYRPSKPTPFLTMPIVYERAFGGMDIDPSNPQRTVCEDRNLVGTGYFFGEQPHILGRAVPNLEHPDHPIESCTERTQPIGYGSIGRQWQPRVGFAGTYDEAWLAEQFPYLPNDFDERYFQGAPPDQRCSYLRGGERMVLVNLTPEGRTEIQVPHFPMSMFLVLRTGNEALAPVLDTLIVEPDLHRCILVWRASMRLPAKLTDIHEVWVGRPGPAQLLAMRREKRYLGSARLET